jgi:hypothetical protein
MCHRCLVGGGQGCDDAQDTKNSLTQSVNGATAENPQFISIFAPSMECGDYMCSSDRGFPNLDGDPCYVRTHCPLGPGPAEPSAVHTG